MSIYRASFTVGYGLDYSHNVSQVTVNLIEIKKIVNRTATESYNSMENTTFLNLTRISRPYFSTHGLSLCTENLLSPTVNSISCGLLCLILLCFPSYSDANPHKKPKTITATQLTLFAPPSYVSPKLEKKYVNPSAPKYGSVTLAGFGSFDTLNPYLLKGISPINTPGMGMYGFSESNETLMVGTGDYLPSGDEPQTAYCLICQKVEYPKDLSWIRFILNPEAAFHDNSKITAEDVENSFTLLQSDLAHPLYKDIYRNVTSAYIVDKHTIQFNIKGENRKALMLRLGELPVMSKEHWTKHAFNDASTTPPLLSGPYKISKFSLGNYIEFQRVDNHWAKEHPLYKGQFNFNSVRIDFFKDRTVALEAFKSGNVDIFYEYVSKDWSTAYDFPAIQSGDVKKEEIKHQIPSGSQAFFLNLRNPLFQDRRVREALTLLFDFEWTNKTIFADAYRRSNSYYPNSPFETSGKPEGLELKYLLPYKSSLPKELFTKGFALPSNDGKGNIRTQLRKANVLLREAGWTLKNKVLTHKTTNTPFEFEFIINQPSFTRVINPYIKNLAKAGIKASVRVVDRSQYKVRLDEKDFDVITYVYPQSLSPNHEQRLYFHSSQADIKGSRNYAGIKNPTVDNLLNNITSATNYTSLTAATKALDRALLWNYYTIPHWHLNYHRVAYREHFSRPDTQPQYTLGFTGWWINPKQ